MKLLKITLLILLLSLVNANLFAQPSISKLQQAIENEELLQPKGRSINLINSTQAGILFKNNTELLQTNAISWLTQKLVLRQNEDQLVDENRDVITDDIYAVKKIHQYYKGIKVEHGIINATSRIGKLCMMQLEYYTIPDRFNISPVLSEDEALNKAKAFVGAAIYAWDNAVDTTDTDFMKPRGELVIIQTYKADGQVCLAYKFNIYALAPMSRAYIYVNAWDGTIVLDDAIIKHAKDRQDENPTSNNFAANPPSSNKLDDEGQKVLHVTAVNRTGTADTRYSGSRQIVTDSVAGGLAKPFRLTQGRNNHAIVTLDFQRKPWNTSVNFEAQAVEFNDNDNNWTTAEFNNFNLDNVALDAHYNMQWVSDYWVNVHQRKGWDNKNSAFYGYVHTSEDQFTKAGVFIQYDRWYDNAFWNGKNMHFGDGNGVVSPLTDNDPPSTSLDDCGHELSHAITSTTSNLVYRWESGAMNEAFSDIWAACITNYAKLNDPSLSDENIWRLFEKSTKPFMGSNAGSRDMQNPLKFNQPSTYQSTNWVPGDYVTCPVETDGADDHCGVHQNSGVLNKWFYLITDGEIGINSKLQPYAITGLGFAKTEKIAYLMELNLTPNAGYATAMDVSLNIVATEYGYGSDEYQTLKNAWYAIGVNSDIYNMANVPAFTTNNFTSIETDGTNIFAGTNYNGLYQFDGSTWKKMTELTDVRINDIKLDMNGDFWIAQSGKTGTVGGGSSIGGGVNYLKSPFTSPSTLYTVNPQLHVPSRNARCIYIDPLRQNDVVNPKVWVATLAYITSGSSTSGMLGQGLYSTGNEFKAINQGINISTGTVGCATVGGLENEIWTFVQANNGINQLLQYHAGTNSLISTYDHNSVPALPSGFVARAIYGDAKKRLWVGLANGGVMLLDEKKHWHQLNFPSIFPAGTAVNFNAITGDSFGDVYIGTTAGLVFFDHGIGEINRLDDSSFYRLYTKSNGLPSSNINALSFSTQNFRLYVATDSGIVFWHPLCIGNSCNLHRFYTKAYSQSKGNGNWGDATNWSTGIIPDSSTIVVIADTITVDINAQCQSLSIINPGSININTGKNLKIVEVQSPINTTKGTIRRQRH